MLKIAFSSDWHLGDGSPRDDWFYPGKDVWASGSPAHAGIVLIGAE